MEIFIRLSSNQSLAVDGESRGALDTQLAGNLGLLLHDLGIFTRVQTFIESRGVQVQAGRDLLEIIFAECSLVFTRLVFKQVIVEFPKSILIGRTFAGLSRPLRFRAEKGEMPVTQTSFTLFYVRIFDLATRASGETPAEGSLKIAEFDDGHRGVGIAEIMACLLRQKGAQLLLVVDLGELICNR